MDFLVNNPNERAFNFNKKQEAFVPHVVVDVDHYRKSKEVSQVSPRSAIFIQPDRFYQTVGTVRERESEIR